MSERLISGVYETTGSGILLFLRVFRFVSLLIGETTGGVC